MPRPRIHLAALAALLAMAAAPVSAQTLPPQAPVALNLSPDLTVELSAPQEVSGGADLIYTIIVRNVGQVAYRDPVSGRPVYFAGTANNIVVVQTLPPGATFKSVAGGNFACAFVAPQVICSGASLQPAQTDGIGVTVTA